MDGQTVFLAGLIKHKQTDERDSVAGFGSIPILGAIFRHKDFQQRDTEVVITLTPTILRNALAAQSGTEASSQASVSIPSSGAAQVSPSTEIMPSLAAEDPVNKYSTMIQSIIYSNIKYPAELKSQAIEGTVKLSLHLLPTGELLGTVVMQSCGNALLDESAEKSVKRLSPFPAFPPEIKLKELWLDIPIVYRADK